MLQDKEFLQEPPIYSLLQRCPLLFPILLSIFISPSLPSIHASIRTLRTGVRILCAICIWYECLCACMWFLKEQGMVGVSQRELASEQGPLQAKCSKEQCNAPGSCPASWRRAPYHPYWGGFGRVLMWAVTSRLSPNGFFLNGDFCVCCERKKQKEREGKRETDKDKWFGSSW